MRRVALITLTAALLTIAGAGGAWAQTGTASITVDAQNIGFFQITIADAAFDFGQVDSNGTLSTTGVSGVRNGSNTGAIYTASGASTVTVSSAPSRTVRVYNSSSSSTINFGATDRLSLQIPSMGGGTSCGYKTFSTNTDGGAASCTGGNLVHSATAGNGNNSAAGDLDLRLEVLDTDAAGTNQWTIVLTATGA